MSARAPRPIPNRAYKPGRFQVVKSVRVVKVIRYHQFLECGHLVVSKTKAILGETKRLCLECEDEILNPLPPERRGE